MAVGTQATESLPQTAALVDTPPAAPRARRSQVRVVAISLALYTLGRGLLLVTAAVISTVHGLPLIAVLRPWDSIYYLHIANHGYPKTVSNYHEDRTDAFFPLYPVVVAGVHLVTGLRVFVSAMIVSFVSGACLIWVAAAMATPIFGIERGLSAAVILAVFPGSAVAMLPYADAFGVALAATCLLLMHRERFVWAGVAGLAATASFSLIVLPLLAAACWCLFVSRRRGAALTAALAAAGVGGYFSFLWYWTGTPLYWFKVEHAVWRSRLGFSRHRGTLGALLRNPSIGALVAVCIVIGALGLVALWRSRAPQAWLVFSSVVYLACIFDTGTHLSPRLLLSMFPAVMALGARVPRRLLVPAVIISLVLLCCCLAIYSPENSVWVAP